MASLFKKSNSKNYYYRFEWKSKPYQASTGKPNKQQAQRVANKREQDIKASFEWEIAFKRLKEALTHITDLHEQKKARQHIASEILQYTGNTLKIDMAFVAWECVPKQKTQNAQTLKDYKSIWNKFSSFIKDNYIGIENMHEISDSMAEAYMNSVWNNNATERTYNKKLTFLTGVFNKLKKKTGSPENPFLDIPQKDPYTVSRKPFTAKQVNSLINNSDGELKTLTYLGTFLGTRLGDAAHMKWDNIDLENSTITYIPKKTKAYQKEITIPFCKTLKEHLESLSPKNDLVLPKLCEIYEKDASKLSKIFNTVVHEIGIETTQKREDGRGQASSIYGFHSLRHFFVSTCKNKGIPQHIVMEWVAHSSELVSAIYTHVDDDSSQKYADKLNDLI